MTGEDPSRFDGPVGEELDLLTLGDALDGVLRARGLEAASRLSKVMGIWDEVCGPQLAAHARPAAVYGPALVIEVDEGAWASELRMLSDEVVTRLRLELGDGVAERLEVRVRPRRGR